MWLKLEEDYQGKMQGKQLEEEEQEQNTHEYKGMNFEYHSDLFDKIDKAIVDYNIDLVEAKKNVEEVLTTCSTDSYANAKIAHQDFKKLKKYSGATYEWYQRKTTMLSNLLKDLKGECITLRRQHDEQDGEIDRLQEVNTYMERQLERARRKEEDLKDQLKENDEVLERQLDKARRKDEDLKDLLALGF